MHRSELHLGADHKKTLTENLNLAVLLKRQGEVAEARHLYEVVVRGYNTQQLGEDHIETLRAKMNVANLLSWQGELAEARRLHEMILESTEWQLGANLLETLTAKMDFVT